MSIFDSNLRIYKATSTRDIDWSLPTVHSKLKVLVVALLADSQEDLILSSSLQQLTAPELKDLTRIRHEQSTERIRDQELTVDTITIGFPNKVFSNQSFTFIHAPRDTKRYNTLILTKSTTKLTTMLLHWMKSQFGVLSKQFHSDSDFIVSCLDMLINGLPTEDKTRLGDVELTFQTHTRNGALSSISIEIPTRDVQKFSTLGDERILDQVLAYLKENTSIQFEKLPINKLKCRFLMISTDGRIRFPKGGMPTLEETDVIKFTAWDFIYKIYSAL